MSIGPWYYVLADKDVKLIFVFFFVLLCRGGDGVLYCPYDYIDAYPLASSLYILGEGLGVY